MADFTALKTAIQNAIKQNGNEEITGNLLQDVLLAIVTTLGDGSINELITSLGTEATTRGNADTTLQQNIDAEAQARQLADSTLQGGINTAMQAINAINNAITNGCVYAGIATPSSTPASGKVFYLALTAGTYTNYGGLEVPQGINILKNNGSTWSLDSFLGIDDAPTPSSNKLVKSGGVFNDIMTNGSAFDLSAYNNGTTYADLNAALTALNALPAAYKRGGMSLKFVLTSDNKYVQYRLMNQNWSTVVTDWQGEEIKTENAETDFSISDKNNYDIVRFKNGHIRTKNFDSSEDATTEKRGLMSATDKSKLDSIEEGAEVNDVITDDVRGTDFSISDENNYDIVQLKDGHIRTKNFDSSKTPRTESNPLFPSIDLSISDDEGNSILQLFNGHLRTKYFDSSKIQNPSTTFHFSNEADSLSYVISKLNDTNDFKICFYVKRTPKYVTWEEGGDGGNFCFNYGYLVNKVTEIETQTCNLTDDICPVQINSSYIGGGHGYDGGRLIKATNHGKSFVDIGSIWNVNGTDGCVLIGIIDNDTLYFMGPNTAVYPLYNMITSCFIIGASIVHTSGATNTSTITIEEVKARQFEPAIKMLDTTVIVDGKIVKNNGDYHCDSLEICESYDILNPASVIETIKRNVGQYTSNPMPCNVNADSVARITNTYKFNSALENYVVCNFIILQNITLNYFGFTQMMPIGGSNRKMYIPKSLPISDGYKTYDFRTCEPYDYKYGLTFDSRYWEDPNHPIDRYLQYTDNIGLHLGYLFDYGIGGSNRKDLIGNALYLHYTGTTQGKSYIRGVDSAASPQVGDCYSAVCFRHYKDRNSIKHDGIIQVDTFIYGEACYLYADFDSVGVYTIPIDTKFIGKSIEILEKSTNVVLLTDISSDKVIVKVSSASVMYGYIVLKIK